MYKASEWRDIQVTLKKKMEGGRKQRWGYYASSAPVSLGVASDWNTYLQRTELTAQK